MNHTSDQHPWFIDSRSSRTSAHRDWYIWRDGKRDGGPPNNWTALFGGPAWKLDATTGQYYYHYFYPQQPDLNWRNPAVEKAMFDIPRWWFKRGVAGFRLDAVDTLFEDPDLRDNPVLPGVNKYGDPNTEPKYNLKLPEVHDVLRDLRSVADASNAVLIGETYTNDIEELKAYYGEHNNELQLPMDMMFAEVNKLSAAEFRHQIASGGVFRRLANLRAQQSRYRPLLRPLRGRPAQRRHRQADGRALPDPAGHSDHVLRRRTWDGEQ